ncbi:hypothetical protein RND81_14G088300 [Saponaria officinalis]|uniref:Uncharacterized protein n=1 Tax=Saponaria officinalis TaxID=3572 RepID=A0AAW1GJW2_SAPOF
MMSSWGNLPYGNLDYCTWNGVECNNYTGHVTGLVLSGVLYNRLDGCLESQVISSSLGELKHLTSLDLSYNNFHGMVIPNFIGTLINLRELTLSESYFGGKIPSDLGNLTRLTSLDLRMNDGLYVESLNWLSQLTLLKQVNLDGTDLSKAKNWSQVVGSLCMLEVLKMDGCLLSSPVPSSSSLQSPNLNTISLSRNGFTSSSVFQWLFNTSHSAKVLRSSLNHLDLSSNFLRGPIPNTIENLEFLEYLDLSHNSLSLSGTLHDTFGQLEFLKYLYLSRNLVSGTLPSRLGNFEAPWYLDLSRNSLSGTIPYTIGDAIYLAHLSLSHNSLSGTIPYTITNMKALVYLDLSYNALKGSINFTIQNLDSLSFLDLSHNSLSGTIPSTIENLYSLTYLDLSYNSLSGPLPDSIWDLMSLTHLDFSHNPLTTVHHITEDVEVKDKGDHKVNIGLYVSIGIGIYTGFWGFWGTLAMKDNWRLSYFKFLDHIIDKLFVKVALYSLHSNQLYYIQYCTNIKKTLKY